MRHDINKTIALIVMNADTEEKKRYVNKMKELFQKNGNRKTKI